MSLELIKKFLKENGKDNPELSVDHIDTAITQATESAQEAAKTRYIAEAGKIRKDIDKLKPFKQVLEDLGFVGPVEELPAFVESLKTARKESGEKPAKTELEKQISALTAQMKALTDENKAAKEREQSLQSERKAGILKERLMKDLGEKLAGGEAHVKTLIYEGLVDLDEDGKTVVFKAGEVTIPYDEGTKRYLKAHEADLKDNQRPGGNSAPGAGRPKADPNMSLEDMMKLPTK